jgi:hypothetical protein
MSESVFLNGIIVGEIKGDTYITRRSAKKHFYRKQQSYPLSVSILEKLKEKKVKHIIIIEYDRNDFKEILYTCYLSDYDHIEPFKEEKFDLQKAIPLRRMTIIEEKKI